MKIQRNFVLEESEAYIQVEKLASEARSLFGEFLIYCINANEFADYMIEYLARENEKNRGGGGSGGTTGNRTGTDESENGTGGDTFTLNDEQRNEVESNIELVVDDNTKNPDNIRLNFWQKFWDANSEMTQEEYDYYTGAHLCVIVKNAKDFYTFSTDKDHKGTGTELGWGGATENGIFLTFGENIFYDDFNWNDGKYSYPIEDRDIFGKYIDYKRLDLTSIIQHEFGHGYAYWTLGFTDYYKIADSDMRENWAIWYTNWSYRNSRNITPEIYGPIPRR